jgi:hypothetical protein
MQVTGRSRTEISTTDSPAAIEMETIAARVHADMSMSANSDGTGDKGEKTLACRVPASVHHAAKLAALMTGQTLSEFITDWISTGVRKVGLPVDEIAPKKRGRPPSSGAS